MAAVSCCTGRGRSSSPTRTSRSSISASPAPRVATASKTSSTIAAENAGWDDGMSERFARMRQVYVEAAGYAPALAVRFADAGLSPADLADQTALDRLPVLKKERLLELQASDPPFAGFLSC